MSTNRGSAEGDADGGSGVLYLAKEGLGSQQDTAGREGQEEDAVPLPAALQPLDGVPAGLHRAWFLGVDPLLDADSAPPEGMSSEELSQWQLAREFVLEWLTREEGRAWRAAGAVPLAPCVEAHREVAMEAEQAAAAAAEQACEQAAAVAPAMIALAADATADSVAAEQQQRQQPEEQHTEPEEARADGQATAGAEGDAEPEPEPEPDALPLAHELKLPGGIPGKYRLAWELGVNPLSQKRKPPRMLGRQEARVWHLGRSLVRKWLKRKGGRDWRVGGEKPFVQCILAQRQASKRVAADVAADSDGEEPEDVYGALAGSDGQAGRHSEGEAGDEETDDEEENEEDGGGDDEEDEADPGLPLPMALEPPLSCPKEFHTWVTIRHKCVTIRLIYIFSSRVCSRVVAAHCFMYIAVAHLH